ncbi:MAG: hypothetical protein ACRCZW_07380 [Lactobacillaceae bacterium]
MNPSCLHAGCAPLSGYKPGLRPYLIFNVSGHRQIAKAGIMPFNYFN